MWGRIMSDELKKLGTFDAVLDEVEHLLSREGDLVINRIHEYIHDNCSIKKINLTPRRLAHKMMNYPGRFETKNKVLIQTHNGSQYRKTWGLTHDWYALIQEQKVDA